MKKSAILLVDDERNVLESLRRVFMDDPFTVLTAVSAADALELLVSNDNIKVIISDEMMPGVSGAELLASVSNRYPDIIRIMLTGHASLDSAIKAINMGRIYHFFTKPWNDLELRFSIKAAINKYDLEAENRKLLDLVKKQAVNLKLIEKQFPGISRLEYDEKGRILVSDVDDKEIEQILYDLEKKLRT
jgi:two-component system, probable response regulator PhcQ